MRGMRTGLPRWARGVRLKPRTPAKPPAPPSLLQLIKDDDHWALQERICITPSVLGEISPHGEFFQDQWPKLLRVACQHMSDKCIGMLVGLKTQGADGPPPLPPHALGWLIEGAQKKEITGSVLENRPGVQALVERAAQGPISLRKADGIRLMELGGAVVQFGTANVWALRTSGGHVLYQQEVFHQAWGQWCARLAHVEQALGFISKSNEPESHRRPWMSSRAIHEFLSTVPEKHHELVRTRIADDLLAKGVAWKTDDSSIRLMAQWMGRFDRNGWEKDHQVWQVWAKHMMSPLAGPPTQYKTQAVVATEWVRILLYQKELKHPLPGWSWNPLIEANVLGALSPGMKNLLDISNPFGQTWNQAATWVREMMELEGRLNALGLREDNPKAWRQAIEHAVGEGWENQVEEVLLQHLDLDEARTFERRWSQWKQRKMEAVLAEPEKPRGPRARM